MPSQFFPEGGDGSAPGERRLMRAVLKDALVILFKYDATEDRRGRRLLAEARHWVESDDAQSTFSFLNVCGALGLSAASAVSMICSVCIVWSLESGVWSPESEVKTEPLSRFVFDRRLQTPDSRLRTFIVTAFVSYASCGRARLTAARSRRRR